MVRGKIWLKTKIIVITFLLLCSLFLPLVPVFAADVSLTFGGSYSPKIRGATTACGSADYNLAYIMNTTNSPCTIGAVQLYGDNWAVSTGQFIELTVSVYNLTDNNSLDAYFSRLNNANLGTWNGIQWVNNIRLANIDYSQVSASNGLVHYLFEVTSAGTIGGIQIAPTWVELKPNEAVSFVMVALYGYPNYGGGGGSTNIQQVITEIQYFRQEFNTRLNTVITNQELIYQALQNQNQSQQQVINEINQINNTYTTEQQQAEQDGQQSQTDSEVAGADAEQATQSLVSVIGDFFGAFINAQATTCEFDMGIILENVDLCSAYIPPVYNVILSIVSILMLVPMVNWLLLSISNAFWEFQQG